MSLVLMIPQEVKLREMRHRALLASWDESKHSRDDDGKFAETEGGGGGKGSSKDEAAAADREKYGTAEKARAEYTRLANLADKYRPGPAQDKLRAEADDAWKASKRMNAPAEEERRGREEAERTARVEKARERSPADILGGDRMVLVKRQIAGLLHNVTQGDADKLAGRVYDSLRWPDDTDEDAARDAIRRHIEDAAPWITEEEALERRYQDLLKEEDAEKERKSAGPRATDNQLRAIDKMLRRLERIDMFDSVGGDGQKYASEYYEELNQKGGISRSQASDMISSISSLLDDEM